jgi:hypothetical protein
MRPWEGRRMSSVQAFYLEDRTSFVFGAWHVFGAVDRETWSKNSIKKPEFDD